MNAKTMFRIASIFGALSVGLGAFAAHGLKSILSPADLHIFQTAVKYQFFHTLVLLILAVLKAHRPTFPSWTFRSVVAGIVIFSGSLYGFAFLHLRWIAAITPVGGALLIISWLGLAASASSLDSR